MSPDGFLLLLSALKMFERSLMKVKMPDIQEWRPMVNGLSVVWTDGQVVDTIVCL